ncbi:hypothetical protein [Diaphorobacter caeni]|uniref:hypothetical protein n=1 Tax=Diaphorobacter caeni TaxID=2784387 RepID=UPI0018901A3A|nr:hypothetical protein [Diaphorobacter caeni]MBF5007537.1 hypothetical protein [Diaphorobacter caeni]
MSMSISTPTYGTLQPADSTGVSGTSNKPRVTIASEALLSQRMGEELKGALNQLQGLVAKAEIASTEGTAIDDQLANFWNDFSDTNEDGMSLGQMFNSKKDALTYVRRSSEQYLGGTANDIRRDIQKMPEGPERDKAMAKLNDFVEISKRAIANDYDTAMRVPDRQLGPRHAPIHPPNYDKLDSTAKTASAAPSLLSEEDDDDNVTFGPNTGRGASPIEEEELIFDLPLKPGRMPFIPPAPIEEEDNDTFRPNIGRGASPIGEEEFSFKPLKPGRIPVVTPDPIEEDDDNNVTFGPNVGTGGTPGVRPSTNRPINVLFADLEAQTALVKELSNRLKTSS